MRYILSLFPVFQRKKLRLVDTKELVLHHIDHKDCFFVFVFFFLAMLYDMLDLTSPTRHPTLIPLAVEVRSLNPWTTSKS